jgi:phosphoribosylaminoimidazole-succinocarboxamide synthase
MNTIFEWLDKASKCGDPIVEHSAKVMKDYYQGASSPKPSAAQRERDEVLARRIQQRKWLKEEND